MKYFKSNTILTICDSDVKYTDRFFSLWYSSCDRSYNMQLRQKDPFQATNNNFLINHLICVYLTISGLLLYVFFNDRCCLWMVSYYFSYPCNWSGWLPFMLKSILQIYVLLVMDATFLHVTLCMPYQDAVLF
jgi:hypothetical protein